MIWLALGNGTENLKRWTDIYISEAELRLLDYDSSRGVYCHLSLQQFSFYKIRLATVLQTLV